MICNDVVLHVDRINGGRLHSGGSTETGRDRCSEDKLARESQDPLAVGPATLCR